jgi:hypothetical protein
MSITFTIKLLKWSRIMVNPQKGLENNSPNRSKVDNLICNPWGLLVIVGLVIALILGFIRLNIFPALKLKESMDIAGLFWGTATILAIVERSIELFIAAWRNPRKKEIEQDIAIFKEKTFQSLPQDQKDRINAKKAEIQTENENIANNLNEIEINQKALQTKETELQDQEKKIKTLADNDPSDPKLEAENLTLETIKAVINELSENNKALAKDIENRKVKLQNLENEHLGILMANPIRNNDSPESKLDDSRKSLTQYETDTAYYALYLGIGFGLFASFAGIRVLQPLVDVSGLETNQLEFFKKLDLVLSALAIAGGTKLFHGLPALISDTLSSTRNLVNKQ